MPGRTSRTGRIGTVFEMGTATGEDGEVGRVASGSGTTVVVAA